MVMTSFNTIQGIPATGSKWLMDQVLRQEWGFDGVVITDYAAIQELIVHGVAEDAGEAAFPPGLRHNPRPLLTQQYSNITNLKFRFIRVRSLVPQWHKVELG